MFIEKNNRRSLDYRWSLGMTMLIVRQWFLEHSAAPYKLERWSRTRGKWKPELVAMIALAVPVVLSELGWMAQGVVDNIMVGRLGPVAIGAVALGNAVYYTPSLFGIGLLLGLDTLVSQAYGRRRSRRVPPVARAGRLPGLHHHAAAHDASRSVELRVHATSESSLKLRSYPAAICAS